MINYNKGTDIIDIYDKMYDDLIYLVHCKRSSNYLSYKSCKYGKNISEDLEYETVDYIEEDKIDDFLRCRDFDDKFKHKRDSLITFNSRIFVNEILKSYNFKKEQIWKQFNYDLPRTKITINDKIVDNVDVFINIMEYFEGFKMELNNHEYNLSTILAMLSNQSSYAFPYLFLSRIKHNFENNIVPSNSEKNRRISFDFNDSKEIVKIKIETDVIMRNMFDGSIPSQFNIVLLLETNRLTEIETNSIPLFRNNGIFLINFDNNQQS